MQSLFYLNLLLLILILVLCISSISFSYTDLDSSTLLHSVTPSDFSNLSISKVLYRTVSYSDMAPKERMTARKRMFRDLEHEGTSSDSQVSHLQNASIETAVDPFDNVIGNSLLSGQASYQKSKQGVIIEYKDIGDNIFRCIHCNAHFWLDEANKKDSRNAPIIYTGCCQEGQPHCI